LKLAERNGWRPAGHCSCNAGGEEKHERYGRFYSGDIGKVTAKDAAEISAALNRALGNMASRKKSSHGCKQCGSRRIFEDCPNGFCKVTLQVFVDFCNEGGFQVG